MPRKFRKISSTHKSKAKYCALIIKIKNRIKTSNIYLLLETTIKVDEKTRKDETLQQSQQHMIQTTSIKQFKASMIDDIICKLACDSFLNLIKIDVISIFKHKQCVQSNLTKNLPFQFHIG